MGTVKKSDLVHPFPWKQFLKSLAVIAIPIALSNLLTTTASMVDTMMVAPLGELSVGALGLCAQFSSLMFSCYWGFVGGGMLFFSQYYGAGDEDGIDRSYGMTLVCMMTVGVIFGLWAILSPESVMALYTNNKEIQVIGVRYLHVVGFAYIMQVFSMVMICLLRATEHVRIPLAASVISVSTNIFLNWVFIYGKFGLPAYGIQGAAMATTCAAFVNMAVILIMAKMIAYPYLFHVRNHFKWRIEYLKIYLAKCFPIICNELLCGIGFMIINMTLGRQEAYVISAVAVFRTLEGLIIGFFAGFSSAASVLVGTCVGAGELEIAFERAKRLVYVTSAFIFGVVVVLWGISQPLLGAMSLKGDSLVAGTRLLIIYGIAGVIRMGNWIQNDTYRAAGDAVTGTVLEIVFMYLVVLPCMLAAAFVFHAPYWVVFICCYIDEPVRYVLMQIHMYSGRWIRPVTEEGVKALASFRKLHTEKTFYPQIREAKKQAEKYQ